jgi:hypothetical protein
MQATNLNYRIENTVTSPDYAVEQIALLKQEIQNRKARSRSLWQQHKVADVAEEPQEDRKVVGKFTLYVTKHEW